MHKLASPLIVGLLMASCAQTQYVPAPCPNKPQAPAELIQAPSNLCLLTLDETPQRFKAEHRTRCK